MKRCDSMKRLACVTTQPVDDGVRKKNEKALIVPRRKMDVQFEVKLKRSQTQFK